VKHFLQLATEYFPFRVVTLRFATEHTRLPPNAVAGQTPEKEGPTPDTATH